MNIRLLKHLGIVAALVGSVAASSVASAAIVSGSTLTFQGLANITGVNSIFPTVQGEIQLTTSTLSFAGYNAPNPLSIPGYTNATGAYLVNLGNFGAAGAFPGVLTLPALAAVDTGAPIAGGVFNIASTSNSSVTGFLSLISTGTFFETGNATPYVGTMFFTVAGFDPASPTPQGYTATFRVTTSTIPVPGAVYMFGSGLLLMAGVMRRKQS